MFSALKVTLNFRKMTLTSKKQAYTKEAPPLPIKYLFCCHVVTLRENNLIDNDL